ncbi:hypothetical protein HOU95_gp114 [Streptomyces phage Hiyaa]|uniref:Uncharacterized protein n=1 Tax=Streptomyces phage Hiyaa TaxID=2499072 RepID=A0A3S9U8X1_9CAUD|nr:hypothetical protein HOU95_gp114 [Streptomyces phage Hiyaa]AZS06693.1 hypothetical protein SEA_HIYAA_54 [Streptomyces phage Hiyaa]
MMDAPMGGGGGLSSLDADFLDGMLALSQQVSALCTTYIKDSDASSSMGVVDMARGTLEQTNYMTEALKSMRGHADGDELRNAEHVENVEVVAAY